MTKHIGHIIVCDEVVPNEQGMPTIINPLPMLFPINIPSNFSFTISIGVFNLIPGQNYPVNIQFRYEDHSILNYNIEVSVPIDSNNSAEVAFSVFNMSCRNVPLKFEGDYVVEVTLESEKKELIVPIKRQQNTM